MKSRTKRAPTEPSPDPRRRRFDAALAGAIVVTLAGSAMLLAVPRNATPTHVPLPRVDAPALALTQREDIALARQAQTEPLDVDVRAVGGELRRYNRAAADDDQVTLVQVRTSLVRAVGKALRRGDGPLRALRAYQAYRFVEELRTWTQKGTQSDELKALGGDFVATLERNAWCVPETPRTPVMGEDVLVVLYKDRWNDLTGLGPDARFALTRDEERLRYGFLLVYPFRKRVYGPAGAERTAFLIGRQRLATIDRLAAVDDAYPDAYARGIVHFQMGRWEAAGASFQRHLNAAEDGPYTLRARNYLRHALDLSGQNP
ncbi:MAG: hypothetical protein AAGN82_25770 [Myxococcota bacterium]